MHRLWAGAKIQTGGNAVGGFDYVIVGSGAAGCVMAYRLSEDPTVKVALLEAGPDDRHPFIHMPKGLAKVMQDPQHLWVYSTEPEAATAGAPEAWVRGRVLGGSTSVNGMMYVRGQPADFNSLAEMAGEDWSWDHIGPAYAALEQHELGHGDSRGGAGPLKVSLPTERSALTEAMVAAGAALGWPRKDDVNHPDDDEAVGYAPRTIYRGKRQSAAVAFLKPARARPNLSIITNALVDRVVFKDGAAVGVEILQGASRQTVQATREVILCAGAMASPSILERSGIGDPTLLESLGIPIVHPAPGVGENLSEHRGLIMQWKLSGDLSQNRWFSGWRLLVSTLRYYLTRSGPMSVGAYEIGAWFRSRPGANRPDAQFLIAPFSFDFANNRASLESFEGMNAVTYPLRPTSRGSLHISSRDPAATPVLKPNYRDTKEDREIMVAAVRTLRAFVRQEPLSRYVVAETMPGADYETDDQILEAYDRYGTCGYHTVGTCRMGRDEAAVVDGRLRVRGVQGLRVCDTSVMPFILSGNTNGPTMALAWRAADLILEDGRA